MRIILLCLAGGAAVARKYVETWEIAVLPGSFLQFDLIMACADSGPVSLEYSRNFGRTWQLVDPPCLPGTIKEVVRTRNCSCELFVTAELARRMIADRVIFNLLCNNC